MTDDERAFLRAIADDPKEDTPRLAYADWLDDNRTDDLARATAEFIRLSCVRPRPRGSGSTLSAWTLGNWHRLVPSIRRHHKQHFGESSRYWILAWQLGARIDVRMRFEFPQSGAPSRTEELIAVVSLWFRRGFLDRMSVRSDRVRRVMRASIGRDQPLWLMSLPEPLGAAE